VIRRDFLRGTFASVVFVACGSSGGEAPPPGDVPTSPPGDAGPPTPPTRPVGPTSKEDDSHRVFPQGVASGDPRPDRVVLWSRVEPAEAGRTDADDIELAYVIAKDEVLADVVARGTLTAKASADHTVRLVPTGLEPGRFYHYRFELAGVEPARVVTTQVGRTKTAPAKDADVPATFVFCSCQDYIGRYWHAWKQLLAEKPDLDFVLFLGDYIYESVNDARFQQTNPERAIKLPDSIDTSPAQDKSRLAAGTLADYRFLYKAYRKDPSLREVHRLWPFIITWDDHEFADDCWQDHSTSWNELDPITKGFTDEKNTARRTAANRAFSEFQPLDVVYKDNLTFPFDIQIYRQLSWGKHVDIFMTDQRSYRADHLIPEGPADFAVGKLTNNSSNGSRYFVRKSAFDTREAAAKPTLLGAPQKAWFVDAVKKSTATWKVWGNEVQVYEMALTLANLPNIPEVVRYTVYVNADQWDGFRSERAEILGAFQAAGVDNLLVCTGDIHSFYAAELHVNFAAPTAKPIGVEYVTAGISSASLRALVDKTIPPGSALRPVAENWAGSADKALTDTNPHLKHADTDAYGYTLVKIDGTKATVTMVETSDPTQPTGQLVGRKTFTTQAGTNKVVAT
jgi:alkaline phosphatase D